jgi:hypothetical protein
VNQGDRGKKKKRKGKGKGGRRTIVEVSKKIL